MSCRFRFVFLQREKERKLQKKGENKSKIRKSLKRNNDQRTEENPINLNLTAFDFVLIRLKERKFFAPFVVVSFILKYWKERHFHGRWCMCAVAVIWIFIYFVHSTQSFKLLLSIEILPIDFLKKGHRSSRITRKTIIIPFIVWECKHEIRWNLFTNCRTWIHQWKWMVTILILDLVNKVYLCERIAKQKEFQEKIEWKRISFVLFNVSFFMVFR